MNLRLPWNRASFSEHDRSVLGIVEEALTTPRLASSVSNGLDDFAARLANAPPRPSEVFSSVLESRIVNGQGVQRHAIPRPGRPARRAAVAIVMIGTLALGTAVAAPALGYNPLKHVVFREVETPPVFGTPDPNVPGPPPNLRWTDPAELQRAVGFPVYVPGYLPEGCIPEESWYYLPPPTRSVNFQYHCVVIIEENLPGTASLPIQRGSVEEISIAGSPALFVSCTWITGPNGTTICTDQVMQVWLEKGDVVIRMVNARPLERSELIRIAESLKPLSAQP